ncbi:MAG: hypothetical protein KAS32_00430, partial [Candidatus Peribacteraceae bacterium]|nr:hypothetical protein [Candidatus Peribacteraceae bacterium]
MRIRQGFVSNSSSSSFIIVVDPIELNTERIIEEKFNGNKTVSSYGHDIDVPRLVDLLISNVKSGINESESIEGNEEEVIAELKTSIGSWDKWDEIYGALFNSPKKDKSYRAKCDRKWKKYDNELKEKAEKMLD